MARMSNKRRLEWSFFLNDRSRITYNELCRKCQHECKQSFRAVVVDCPKYLSKRSKKAILLTLISLPLRNAGKPGVCTSS